MTRRLSAIVLAAYALHFAWEMAQAKWFTPMQELPFWSATAWCARAAGWDVVISAAAYAAAALIARDPLWPAQRRQSGAAVVAYLAAGLTITIAIERWAVNAGRWRYADAMPTIAGTGATPLLQWIVIPAAILVVIRWVTRATHASR